MLTNFRFFYLIVYDPPGTPEYIYMTLLLHLGVQPLSKEYEIASPPWGSTLPHQERLLIMRDKSKMGRCDRNDYIVLMCNATLLGRTIQVATCELSIYMSQQSSSICIWSICSIFSFLCNYLYLLFILLCHCIAFLLRITASDVVPFSIFKPF